MDERTMTRGFPWGEPAHPGIVRHYEDLIAIYRIIRAQLQQAIDRAFDHVSRDIGFVVSTTLPAVLEITDNPRQAQWALAEPLQGSLFDKSMMEAVRRPDASQWSGVPPGRHQLYLVWFDALKLIDEPDEAVGLFWPEVGFSW